MEIIKSWSEVLIKLTDNLGKAILFKINKFGKDSNDKTINNLPEVLVKKAFLISGEEPTALIKNEDKFFIKCGVAGIFANRKELEDLYLVLNYYLNIEKFAECQVKVGDQDVAIH